MGCLQQIVVYRRWCAVWEVGDAKKYQGLVQ